MKKEVKGLENKSQRGISLITLVITIVVMIILALITMEGSGIQIEEASTAEYKYELKGIEVTVSAQRTSNQLDGIGEEFKEKGFTPVIIKNPPKEYTSFDGWDLYGYDAGTCYGYVIDLENINEDGTKRGNEYSKYQTFEANKTITFGKNGKDNDVYIYDAAGKVYYAKGFYIDGGVYFSDIFYDEDPVDIENNYEEIETAIYRVTYHYNNGTTENQTVEKNENKTIRLIPPIKPEREGFVLKGWSKNSAATNVDYEVGALFAEDRNIDLYAVWQKGESKKYEITFNANGGTNAPSKIEKKEGETVTLPTEIPTRSGYVFDGWSKNSKAVEGEYQAGTAYAEDDSVVLFAIWSTENAKVEIEVTPSDNAGNVVGAGDKKAGNIVYITATAKNGYAFKKWSVKAGSVSVELDDVYAEKTKFVMPNGRVLLKAEFEEKEYDYVVKYNANNGTNAPNTQYKKHDEGIKISGQIPTREGYIFKGWTDTLSSNTVKYNPSDNYSENKNTTLYAIWSKEETRYTITFDANGGQILEEGSARTTRYVADGQKLEEMELGIPEVQREGHYFMGWFTEKTDGIKISETTIANETIEGLKLYAQWRAEIYTITAEKTINGNINPTVGYVDHGQAYNFEIIPSQGYEINDVKIDGISVKSKLTALESGDAKKYTFENVKKNQKISAEFNAKIYTITFNLNGGTLDLRKLPNLYNRIQRYNIKKSRKNWI